MGALLRRFQAAGIAFAMLPGGRLNATGPIDDTVRAAIREHKAAILAELTAANDAATPEQEAELRELIELILANNSEADRAEALAVALADPDAALTSFRLLAIDTDGLFRTVRAHAREADDRRTCAECKNLSTRGQCLAAWRGEAKSWPWFAPQNYHPVADLPQCCPSLRPLISDTDQRAGAERWPYQTRGAR